jgi:GDP-L-fucose synthase
VAEKDGSTVNLKNKRVMVTGGSGFLGLHIVSKLNEQGARVFAPPSDRCDLRTLVGIRRALDICRPDIVIHAAAKAGGIGLNQARPAELFYDNAIMGIQLIEEAHKFRVEKFVTIGTVCEYPKRTLTPFREESIWSGYPEETNAAYGLAKKMLLVQGQAYRQQYGFNVIHLLPVNLYGPGDNFHPESSHVIPALIRKISDAKRCNSSTVSVWGDGTATREFLYVEDAAEAVVLATKNYNHETPANIGSGQEVTIKTLAIMIADKIGYEGALVFDSSKPNGQLRRQLDISRALNWFGFRAKTEFETGLDKTIKWYLENQ